jgi:Ssp1 endopeptidase immunity protein Rap1a
MEGRMARTIAKIWVFGLLVVVITPAGAQEQDFDSANFMLPQCKRFLALAGTAKTSFAEGVCAGSITAFAFVGRSLNNGFCLPKDATNGQMVHVVVAYIEARPNRWHQDWRDLALEAMREAWPCR